MGKPIGTKNRTYSETDKEKILLEHYNDHISWKELCRKYNLSSSLVYDWDIKYKSKGVDGLKSNRGKHKNHHGDLYFRHFAQMVRSRRICELRKGPLGICGIPAIPGVVYCIAEDCYDRQVLKKLYAEGNAIRLCAHCLQ